MLTAGRASVGLAIGAVLLCCAGEVHAEEPAPVLELGWDGAKVLSITVRNAGTTPMLLLRPYHPSLWYGFELEIRGPKGRFGFVPAPSPFVADGDAFLVLHPGESLVKALDLTDVVASDIPPSSGGERAMLKCPGVYRASLAYTFDLAAAVQARRDPTMARAFDALAAISRPYEPLRPTRSHDLAMVVR